MDVAGQRNSAGGETMTEREEGVRRVRGRTADYHVWSHAPWGSRSLGGETLLKTLLSHFCLFHLFQSPLFAFSEFCSDL